MVETEKSVEYRKNIYAQVDMLKAYVEKFEVFVAKDEAALKELCDMMGAIVCRVAEIEDAHVKRIQLMNELSRACSELEESQKKFIEKVNVKA